MVENRIELVQDKGANNAAGHDDSLINKMAQDNLLGPNAKNNNNQLMSFEAAPENLATRYGMVTLKGLGNLPKGVLNALEYDVKNPLQTLETVGTAAGMAVVLKTVLPEGGMAGKVAGAAIGAYFTYKAAEPIIDAYKQVGNAHTMRDLNMAGVQIGDAGGSFLVNSAIAAAGYKLGSHYTERVLTSRSMDGFADAKANFYDKVGNVGSRITDNLGLTTPKNPEVLKLAGSLNVDTVKFAGSERNAPISGEIKGAVDPKAEMEVSVMLKSKASELRMDRTLARISEGRQAPLSDAEIGETFGASKESLSALTKFANEKGLVVEDANLTTGRVVLKGSTGQMAEAFQTRLNQYENAAGVSFRAREGSLMIPKSLSEHIDGILGVDNRPQARSHATKFVNTADIPGQDVPGTPGDLPPGGKLPHWGGGFMPNEVADAYNFPKTSMGKGQAVAIIELGGGIDMVDNAKYYSDHGLPQPSKIQIIEVGGAKNAPGGSADGEVLLDSQVIGAVAPEATQNLIFAPNSDKGFVDAVLRSAFPEKGEQQATSISISWGQNEESWTPQAIDGMNSAFKKAALKGISVFAASGDDGAGDRAPSGTKQTDYPASDPNVTGSGGTNLRASGGKITREVAWSAGGGGVSQVFPPQDFQADVKVPANANTGKPGRGVPDVAGNADPATGYRIRVNGDEGTIGGTSAVSPLYSALMMRIHGTLGKPVPNLNAWLYKNQGIFNDITVGDNDGYVAGKGYDAVTGLGSIDGTKMLNALKVSPHVQRSFGNYQYMGPTIIGGVGVGVGSDQKH